MGVAMDVGERTRLEERVLYFDIFVEQKMAEPAGFEPANAGTKTQCLTTWRRLNLVIMIP